MGIRRLFRKVKDKLDRDTETSMFVQRTASGRTWKIFDGDTAAPGIETSRWSPEERRQIERQFKIKAPQAFLTSPRGQQMYFYGNAESRAIEKKIARYPDPTKLEDAKEAEKVRKEIIDLKTRFAVIARKD